MVLTNGVWAIEKLTAHIPEDPFEVLIDGKSVGTTKLLAFAKRAPATGQFPQILVLYSSGYLRLKAGADPTPPLPFGQSIVLGPAIWGTSTSFPDTTLFFRPQICRVDIDTSGINRDGTRSLLIGVRGSSAADSPGLTGSNRIMDLAWTLTLDMSNDQSTMLDVAGTFEFREEVIPDPIRTAEAQSVRLMQISSMFIDRIRHDVDGLRFRNADGVETLEYSPEYADLLMPATPSALDAEALIFDSLQTDALGHPNGNAPNYRVTIESTAGPMSGPITVRAFFNRSQDCNDDNLGVWAFQQPPERIARGTTGSIRYTVIASTDPPLPIDLDSAGACRRYHERGKILANRRHYDDAIEQFKKAKENSPKYVEIYDSWGWALIDQAEDDDHRSRQATSGAHVPPVGGQGAGPPTCRDGRNGDQRQEKYQAAIKQFEAAIAIDPERSAPYHHNIGLVHVAQGHHGLAIKEYKIAIELDPKIADVHHSWGRALKYKKQYLEAVEHYQKAIAVATSQDKIQQYHHSWGLLLADCHDYGSAIKQYQKATEIKPAYAEAYHSWGNALADQARELVTQQRYAAAIERYDAAITKFSQACGINPAYAGAYHSWGRTLAGQARALAYQQQYSDAREKDQQAITQYEKACEIDPGYPDAYYSLGWALSGLKRYKEAIAPFTKARDIRRSAEDYNGLGFAYASLGRYHEARGIFADASEIFKSEAMFPNQWGWVLASQKCYGDAISKFEEATSKNPRYSNAYNNWGWALAHEKRYDEAIDKYEKVIEICGKNICCDYVYAHHNYAKALWEQGKYRLGYRMFKNTREGYQRIKQEAITSNDSNCFYNYGDMLHDIFGDFNEAEQAYNDGLGLDPENTLIYVGLAYLYLEEKDDKIAITRSLGVFVRPGSVDPRADAFWKARNAYRRAESLINKQRKIETANLFLLQQLAELHLAMEEYAKARKVLKEILRIDPGHSLVYADLGILSAREEDFKAAIQYFETAKRLDPHNLTIRSNLAEAYRNDGQLQNAEMEYERILRVAPDHVESHIGIGEVYSAMGDAGGDSELYDHAVSHFYKGVRISANKNGRRLTKKKLAAAYYSSGYARVKFYELSGVMQNESLMHEALRDFKNCFDIDPDHYNARIGREKLQKRLSRSRIQRFGEAMAPWVIFVLSTLVFANIQIHFFLGDGKLVGNYGFYAMLTFGSLLFAVAGLFLPHVLKLKVGVIELEKSPVEQITTLSSLGIKK